MASINLVFPHSLSNAEALDRIKSLMDKLSKEYEGMFTVIHEQWLDNGGTFTFSANGSQVTAEVELPKPGELTLSASLSFPASLFKGKIEATIKEKATELLTS